MRSSTSADLARVAEEFFTTREEVYPLLGILLGGEGPATTALQDVSEAGEARARARYDDLLQQVRAIPTESLDDTERTTSSMMQTMLVQELEQLDQGVVEMTLDAFFGGPQAQMLLVLPKTVVRSAQDAEDHLERLAGIPTLFTDTLDRLRSGAARGLTVTDMGARAAIVQARAFATSADLGNPLLMPLEAATAAGVALPADLEGRATKLLADVVRPAYAAFADAIEADILATGRPDDRAGLCHLESGPDVYRAALRRHTTTERTPEEIHELGLACIAELAEEYAVLGQRALGTGDLPTIFSWLREDPDLRYADPEHAVADAQACVDRAAAVVGDWIGRLPAKPCVVSPMPEAAAKGMTVAYYQPPQGQDGPHGTYWINTFEPVVTRYEAEAVAFHEAVPGHHTQLALQAELDLPRFRQVGTILSGYQEGWGLYTERLADEMGLYSSDIARLGMVATDSLRACRLVVDTGIHHLGWTRQQAIDYMLANSPLGQGFIVAEVNRYIVYPGQACAYMIGRHEIVRLRAKAEQAMGDRFDLRAFHDVVLGQGSVPLTTLAANVDRWLAAAS